SPRRGAHFLPQSLKLLPKTFFGPAEKFLELRIIIAHASRRLYFRRSEFIARAQVGRMTIIGLAYNQKPEHSTSPSTDARGDEAARARAATNAAAARDAFAEWDSAATIAAVESA